MTDTETTTDEVTENAAETTASKTGKKARKKKIRKSVETTAENVTEQVTEAADELTASDGKRAKLVDKLKDMGVMAGTKSTAAAASAAKGLDLNLPKWMSPQLIAVAAGAGIFTVLIWALQQEKQTIPQQAARPVQQMYNPYAMPPGPYPVPAPRAQEPFEPAIQDRAQAVQDQYAQPAPPNFDPYGMAPPPGYYSAYPTAPQAQAQNKPNADSQTGTSQNQQAYPPAGWRSNRYGYGYGYHPAMRFGFNGYMQGNGASRYNGYAPPPGYGYAPNNRPGNYAYPPQTAPQR